MKTLKTILISISILSAIALWFTRHEWQNSLSAFALSENVMYYRIMHIAAVSFFLIDSQRNKHSYFLALGMALILIFDMYHHYWLHFIVTIGTLLFGIISIIVNSKGFNRHLMYFLSFGAAFIFGIGYFVESFHFLMAEIIAMIFIMNGKLYEIYNDNKNIIK